MFVTDAHLGVALEYAAGGELFDTVARAGKLPEIEARYFFQQLILGLEYCHNRVGPHGGAETGRVGVMSCRVDVRRCLPRHMAMQS